MYEIFEQLLQKNHVTTYQVSKATGIAQSTFSSWKSRRNLISGEKAKKIADYFKVSVDYLLGRTDKIMCNDCGFWYDPLNNSDATTHVAKHKQWESAVKKYGFCWNRIKADERELMCRRFLKDPNIDPDIAVEYVEDILKAMFSNELREHDFSYPHDFNYFVAMQLEKYSFRDIMPEKTLTLLEDKYKTWKFFADDTAQSFELNSRDNRDIKKDLDSIMEKLSSKEYGPAAYDGEELSDESAALFKEELEIALKRLKLINKEKYNPNKNKK